MLIKVRAPDYAAPYTYEPPQVAALINTDEIVSAVPTEARGSGPFLLVRFRDGTTMIIAGTVDTLLVPPDIQT